MRSVLGSPLTSDIFNALSRHPRVLEPARNILGGDLHVYQFKINCKAGLSGDVWEWHQDFIFWQKEDGMPASRVINVSVFLDDVTEFNGPLLVLPGSHKHGLLDVPASDSIPTNYENDPSWISTQTAALKYSFNKAQVADLTGRKESAPGIYF